MRKLLWLAWLVSMCLLTACSSGGTTEEPTDNGWDPDTNDPYDPADSGYMVGPPGAVLTVDDPESPSYGLQVVVAPGAIPEYRTFYIAHDSLNVTTTPWLPSGFNSWPRRSEGCFELSTSGEPPWDLEVTMRIPVSDITVEPGEVICAFYHDREADRWRFVLPQSIDENAMTVVTTYRHTWNWGKVDVSRLDMEYLEPALTESMGASGWQQLVDAVDSIATDIENENVTLSCASLRSLQSGLLETFRQGAAQRLQDHADALGSTCGSCDPFTDQFTSELMEFIEMKFETALLELFADSVDSLILEFMARLKILILDFEARELACNYSCVQDERGLDFWMDLGVYHLAGGLQYMIDWAIAVGAVKC